MWVESSGVLLTTSKSGLYCWVDKRGDVVPDAEKLIEKCCNCEANDVPKF
ncbi:hypothetical protein DEO72_LG5g282 [Vigna unguiculata]|uniref:Uncharacterized protein n=1 Tax=Vigna unguiculata TaxID=3917 RepID=A0A4D6LUX1_VIGUN|nr:hypothetical protein DEO72_LG5g282 [Vigna unguiculata]